MPDLTEIREALAKATPGPWRFGIGAPCHTGVWGTRPDANWNVCWTGDELTRYSSEDAHLIANAPAWLAELCNQVERLTRERDAAYVLHDFEIKSGRECCPCGVAADKAIARAEKAEAAVERVRSLADWHEAKADKARRFPGAEVAIMEKAARVHEDAARRLRAALDGE